MKNDNAWKVCVTEGYEYLYAIHKFLLSEYENLFGEEIMFAEECIIFNDSQSECPMLITNTTPILIRLSQSSLSYWAQTIFQLSHELCHYAMRQRKLNKNFTLSWFEEIVCEAMSLYFLKCSFENWSVCELSEKQPLFNKAIEKYLKDELEKEGTDDFQNCVNYERLREYEQERSTIRETHRNERNLLYYEIIKNPKLCKCFCDYPKYLMNNLTINFEKWLSEDENHIVKCLSSIQPYK